MTAKKKVAALVTVYHKWSHADVILGKLLEGYLHDGKAGPNLQLASMFVDQFPSVPPSDMSKALAKKHGFTIHDTIAKTLTLGGAALAVELLDVDRRFNGLRGKVLEGLEVGCHDQAVLVFLWLSAARSSFSGCWASWG